MRRSCRVASNERWTTFVPFEQEDIVSVLSSWPGRGRVWGYWAYFEDFGVQLRFWENASAVHMS